MDWGLYDKDLRHERVKPYIASDIALLDSLFLER